MMNAEKALKDADVAVKKQKRAAEKVGHRQPWKQDETSSSEPDVPPQEQQAAAAAAAATSKPRPGSSSKKEAVAVAAASDEEVAVVEEEGQPLQGTVATARKVATASGAAQAATAAGEGEEPEEPFSILTNQDVEDLRAMHMWLGRFLDGKTHEGLKRKRAARDADACGAERIRA